MPCYHPLHAYKGKSEDSYKIKIAFRRSDSWRGEKIELPCGQCIGCRLERSRQWAIRCVHEASLYDKNCFLTLTYNDENLPKDGSLKLEDYQLFMKRLRKRFGQGIRFFHCGEYGEEQGRPHYHSLLFNHDFSDKKYFKTENGNAVYTSDELDGLWKKGHGIIGDVTFESAGYVARYALKKVTGEKAVSHYGDKKPEYCTMSRRPGIGFKWFEKFLGDVYPKDDVWVNGVLCKPPKYYDGLLQKKDASTMMLLKIKREEKAGKNICVDVLKSGKFIVESDSCDRRLLAKEETKEGQLKLLSRHKDGVI